MSLTLWDIMLPRKKARKAKADARPLVIVPPPKSARKPVQTLRPSAKAAPRPDSAQARYDLMTRTMLARYGVRVRKWRSGMCGVAWQVTYQDGTVSRLIEAPRPKGPMSAAVFLHEIGHHAIGFHTYSPRCLEEYHAWKYAIEQMAEWDLNITKRVHDRMHDSLHYAVEKARRRGLKVLPPELEPYRRARPRPAASARQPATKRNATAS